MHSHYGLAHRFLPSAAQGAAWGFCFLLVCLPLQAQAQGATPTAPPLINFFQSLWRPAAASDPADADEASAEGTVNPATSIVNLGSAGSGDLLQLVSQSIEQIDEAREIQIGQQLAAVLLGSKPLYPDLALQRYVNQLGRWISLQSSRPGLPWTFAVLDDPGFNAFAAPGGYVFVTKGLIDKVKDEGELAGILSHEMTHVIAKHHLIALNKAARSGLLTQLLGSQLKSTLAGQASLEFLNLGRNIYGKGLEQQDEFDADRAGVALATRAGFDPYGLVAVLQQLRGASPRDSLFALSLNTHPAPQTRLNRLEQAMGRRLDVYAQQMPNVTVAQRLVNSKADTGYVVPETVKTP